MNVIKIRHLDDMLILIPHLLGYYPHNRLVLLSLDYRGSDATGRRACVGPIASIELPRGKLEADIGPGYARLVRRTGIRDAVLVAYGKNAADSAFRCDLEEIARLVQRELRANGGEIFGVYTADEQSWIGSDGRTHLWEEGKSSTIAAAMVYSGSAPADRPPDAGIRPASSKEQTEAARAAAKVHIAGSKTHTKEGLALWESLLARKEEALNIRFSNPALLGVAGVYLTDSYVRDRVLYHAICPAGEISLAQIEQENLQMSMASSTMVRPHVNRVERVIALLDACASLDVPGQVDSPAASAYLCWWIGSNTRAAARVALAAHINPCHSLTTLMMSTLERGLMPPWMNWAGEDTTEEHRLREEELWEEDRRNEAA